jgi:hypothetical protein
MMTQKPAMIMSRITDRNSVPGVEGSSSGESSVSSGAVVWDRVSWARVPFCGVRPLRALGLPAADGVGKQAEHTGEEEGRGDGQQQAERAHLSAHELVQGFPQIGHQGEPGEHEQRDTDGEPGQADGALHRLTFYSIGWFPNYQPRAVRQPFGRHSPLPSPLRGTMPPSDVT